MQTGRGRCRAGQVITQRAVPVGELPCDHDTRDASLSCHRSHSKRKASPRHRVTAPRATPCQGAVCSQEKRRSRGETQPPIQSLGPWGQPGAWRAVREGGQPSGDEPVTPQPRVCREGRPGLQTPGRRPGQGPLHAAGDSDTCLACRHHTQLQCLRNRVVTMFRYVSRSPPQRRRAPQSLAPGQRPLRAVQLDCRRTPPSPRFGSTDRLTWMSQESFHPIEARVRCIVLIVQTKKLTLGG